MWATPPPPVFYRGQRVFAKWCTDTGALHGPVNRTAGQNGGCADGFPAAILGAGVTPGSFRVAFDDKTEHPNVPAISRGGVVAITPQSDSDAA